MSEANEIRFPGEDEFLEDQTGPDLVAFPSTDFSELARVEIESRLELIESEREALDKLYLEVEPFMERARLIKRRYDLFSQMRRRREKVYRSEIKAIEENLLPTITADGKVNTTDSVIFKPDEISSSDLGDDLGDGIKALKPKTFPKIVNQA